MSRDDPLHPWVQPIIIVILAAALAGMTTFALTIRSDYLAEVASNRTRSEQNRDVNTAQQERIRALESDVAAIKNDNTIIWQEIYRARGRLEKIEGRR